MFRGTPSLTLLALLVITVTIMSPSVSAASSCNNNTNIECFDCDSRYNELCKGPFKNTTLSTKKCNGCCAIMMYKPPHDYIVRTCINLQSPSLQKTSVNEITTVCNENHCNFGSSEFKINVPVMVYLVVLATVKFTNFSL